MWLSVSVFFLISGLYIYEVIKPSEVLNSLCIIAVVIPIFTNFYGNYEYFPKNYRIISQIKLDSDTIQLYGFLITFKKIKIIEISVNDWHGKKIVTNLTPYSSGPKLSRGINNHCKIIYDDSESKEFDFQINSLQHFQELSEWIKNLYQTKIEIKEEYGNLKSYGLEHLNYKQIQEFKKKYTI